MKLSIADLTVEIKNCNYDYIINKTRKYQSGSVGPADMTINCFISEKIVKPEGRIIEDVEGWSWCIAENGEKVQREMARKLYSVGERWGDTMGGRKG